MSELTYTYQGSTDSVTDCDCCGKSNLKKTFVLLNNVSGEINYFGSHCAKMAAGWTNDDFKVVKGTYKAEQKKIAVSKQSEAWKLHCRDKISYEEYVQKVKEIQIEHPLVWRAVYNTDLRNK